MNTEDRKDMVRTRFKRAYTETMAQNIRHRLHGDYWVSNDVLAELNRCYEIIEHAERMAEIVKSDICERERSAIEAREFLKRLSK